MSVIRNRELEFEPGSKHEYSNSNYLLLGVILEKATGKNYGELLSGLTVDQMGSEITYYLSRPPDFLIADAYDETLLHLGRRNLTGFRRSMETGAFSAGGIISTAEDVASFIHLVFTGEIISAVTLAQMESFVLAADADVAFQRGYGLGLRNLVIDGESLFGHTGSIPGYSGIAMHKEEK